MLCWSKILLSKCLLLVTEVNELHWGSSLLRHTCMQYHRVDSVHYLSVCSTLACQFIDTIGCRYEMVFLLIVLHLIFYCFNFSIFMIFMLGLSPFVGPTLCRMQYLCVSIARAVTLCWSYIMSDSVPLRVNSLGCHALLDLHYVGCCW